MSKPENSEFPIPEEWSDISILDQIAIAHHIPDSHDAYWETIQHIFTKIEMEIRQTEEKVKDIDLVGIYEITSCPDGPAPENVRQAWIGLHLPALSSYNWPSGMQWCPRTTSEGKTKISYVFQVPKKEGISILATKDENAAQWFIDNWGEGDLGFWMDCAQFDGFGALITHENSSTMYRFPNIIQDFFDIALAQKIATKNAPPESRNSPLN